MIWIKVFMVSIILRTPITTEAGLLVRVHPDPCLILIRAQIRALLLASKSKFIRAQTLTLQVLDKKKRPLLVNTHEEKSVENIIANHLNCAENRTRNRTAIRSQNRTFTL
jgi:hypothetical protein